MLAIVGPAWEPIAHEGEPGTGLPRISAKIKHYLRTASAKLTTVVHAAHALDATSRRSYAGPANSTQSRHS